MKNHFGQEAPLMLQQFVAEATEEKGDLKKTYVCIVMQFSKLRVPRN